MQKDVDVHVYQHGARVIDTEAIDNFVYEHYTFHGLEDVAPLRWFEASPVMSKRIVFMHVQVESDSTVSVLWGGNTWEYKAALDEAAFLLRSLMCGLVSQVVSTQYLITS